MSGVASGVLEFDGRDAACAGGEPCSSGAQWVGTRRRIAIRRAHGFLSRLVGLIGQPLPAIDTGLWIEPCAAVHTFGVRGAIDVVFVSRRMVVLRIDAGVLPGRLRVGSRCRSVLELRAGEAARLGLRTGARLEWCANPTGVRR